MKPAGFVGTWHIREMEVWDRDYFNVEVQAYIKVEAGARGEFQFGLVHGSMDGRVIRHPDGNKFEFTWEGNDECDDVLGSGWFKLKDDDENAIEGEIKIHDGDCSKFVARRVATTKRKLKNGESKKR